MEALATIKKQGDKYVILSKDGKKLGEADTREAAVKRLKQIEFFKNKGSSRMTGTLAGNPTERVIDGKDHFPISTEAQAQNAILRASRVYQAPDWFNGDANDLRQMIRTSVALKFPDLRVSAKITAEQLFDITEGGEFSEHVNVVVKDPNSNPPKVPQVETPKIDVSKKIAQKEEKKKKKPKPALTSYSMFVQAYGSDQAGLHAFAGDLVENLKKREDALKVAQKVAKRLTKDGVTSEEFNALFGFLQEDILRELLTQGVTASKRTTALNDMVDAFKKKVNPSN